MNGRFEAGEIGDATAARVQPRQRGQVVQGERIIRNAQRFPDGLFELRIGERDLGCDIQLDGAAVGQAVSVPDQHPVAAGLRRGHIVHIQPVAPGVEVVAALREVHPVLLPLILQVVAAGFHIKIDVVAGDRGLTSGLSDDDRRCQGQQLRVVVHINGPSNQFGDDRPSRRRGVGIHMVVFEMNLQEVREFGQHANFGDVVPVGGQIV